MEHTTGPASLLRGLTALGACTFALLVLAASPALAHGGGGSTDATNYRSTVDGIRGPDADAPVPAIDGLTWRVLAGDALLEAENRTGEELLVPGYQDEPYLRFAADGVWQNRRSPATYLNSDRYAAVELPAEVDVDAAPDWARVAGGSRYAWHDHRIHYMAAVPPPQVAADPGREQAVFESWEVPFTLDGEQHAVVGQLDWVPGPSPWPWIGRAAAVMALLLVGAVGRRGGDREAALVRMSAWLLLAVTVIDVAHTVDDLLAVPATVGQTLAAGFQSVAFLAIAAFGVRAGLRGRPGAPVGVVVGMVGLTVFFGLLHLPALTSSQVASVVPAALTRLVVAINLALLVPVAPLAVVALRQATAPSPEPSGQVGAEAAT